MIDPCPHDFASADYCALCLRSRIAVAEDEAARLRADVRAAQDAHARAVCELTARARCYDPSHEFRLRLSEISAAFEGEIPKAWTRDATGSVVQRIAALRKRIAELEADARDNAAGSEAVPPLAVVLPTPTLR